RPAASTSARLTGRKSAASRCNLLTRGIAGNAAPVEGSSPGATGGVANADTIITPGGTPAGASVIGEDAALRSPRNNLKSHSNIHFTPAASELTLRCR